MEKNDLILVIDAVHSALIERLEAEGYTCFDGSKESDDVLQALLPQAMGLVLRSRWSLNQSWLERNQHLRFVGRVGAGLEHIDVKAAETLSIQVLSSPEGNRQAVAEQALGMLLNLLHRIRSANDEVREGVWQRKQNEGLELQGKTVGIIGYGNTGSAFGKLLSGFGVEVLAYDKYKKLDDPAVKQVGMEALWKRADVVSLHIPQDADTIEMVNRAWLHRFERSVFFINTSRGKIVVDKDLLDAVNEGKVIGAALDVLSIEREDLSVPAWEELPGAARGLIGHPRVLVTPHIAGLSKESYEKLATTMAEKIIALLRSA